MFKLHSRLAEDCFQLGDFSLSRLLLMNDTNYPWFILVPRIPEISEIYHLSQTDQVQLSVESSALSETIMRLFNGDKMNIAALGNVVPQLHIHHVVRFKTDKAWPDPVWGKFAPVFYDQDGIDKLKARLVSAFPIEFALE